MNRVWDIRQCSANAYLKKFAGTEKQKALLHGKLKQTRDGFTYVDVSNDVINGLFRLLEEDDIQQPPYREDKYNNVGAHISVFSNDEVEESDLMGIEEIGNLYSFHIQGIYSLIPEWKGVKKVWVVDVESPELESLRRKYGLTPKLRGHEFHITIGIQR